MSDEIFVANQTLIVPGQNNDFDQISDDIYYSMLDLKKSGEDFSRQPWFMKLVKSSEYKDMDGKAAKEKIKTVMNELM